MNDLHLTIGETLALADGFADDALDALDEGTRERVIILAAKISAAVSAHKAFEDHVRETIAKGGER